MEGFEDNIESKNVASASKPTNNPPESTVVVEATSTVADDEVQVLGKKCSRIFHWRTPNAKQCTNWAVKGGRARKAQYCPTCAKELKERDNARKRKEREPTYEKKRKVKHEKGEEKTGCEEKTGGEEKNEEIEVIPQEENQKVEKLKMTPQKVELVVQEKVAPLIQGYDKVRVIMPSLALLSQIVGLRFMFHQDMDSIGKDSSWFEVEDCRRRTTRGGSKTIGHYLPFGWKDTDWKHDMGQWANPHQLCVFETLMKEMKEVLPNKRKMQHTTLALCATEKEIMTVPHCIFDAKQNTEGEIGWSFHLPLCGEGSHLFLYDYCTNGPTSVQKVHIPFGCALLTRHDIAISGNAGSFGNIRLHGTFTYGKLVPENRNKFLVTQNHWSKFVKANKWLKNCEVGKHEQVSVLKDNILQDEVQQKLLLLKKHYALPDDFNANLKK